jgi:hypothetical protein
MKIYRVVARLVPTALVAVAFAASAADAARIQTLTGAAKATLEELKHNDLDRVEARFDARMSEALPIDKLTSTWQTITQQIGAVGACKDAKTSEHDGFLIVDFPCDAANTPINVRFVYDTDNKIAGMFIQPSKTPAG